MKNAYFYLRLHLINRMWTHVGNVCAFNEVYIPAPLQCHPQNVCFSVFHIIYSDVLNNSTERDLCIFYLRADENSRILERRT